jgi:PA14 domain-containing protein/FecR-like protein
MFRPMLIRTAQAQARVLGTSLEISSETNSTRLEVFEGKVRFTRTSDQAAVDVTAGHYAVTAPRYELAALPHTGGILRECWTNVPGEYISQLQSDVRYPDHSSSRAIIPSFQAPLNQGENYGARFRAFLEPPKSGKYTFWISAHEEADLFLSRDDNPGHRRQIAYASVTAPREWSRHGQRSPAITLVAGRKYYLEALHKQSKGVDHLEVAWEAPDRPREIISGEFLSPFSAAEVQAKP